MDGINCTCVSNKYYTSFEELEITPKTKKLCNNCEYIFGIKKTNKELFLRQFKNGSKKTELKLNFNVSEIFCSENRIFLLEKIGLKTRGESITKIHVLDGLFNDKCNFSVEGVCTSFLEDKGRIYLGSSYGYIYCIDINGNFIWKTKLPDRTIEHGFSNFYGAVAPYNIRISNEKILCSSYENIYVFDRSGNMAWSWSVPTEGENNTLKVGDYNIKYAFGNMEKNDAPIAIVRGATINRDGLVRCVYKNILYEVQNGKIKNEISFGPSENFCNLGSDDEIDFAAIESRKRVYEEYEYSKYGQDFSEVIFLEGKKEKVRIVSPFQSEIQVRNDQNRVYVWDKFYFSVYSLAGECLITLRFKYEISNIKTYAGGTATICAGNFYLVNSGGDLT
jgi:hypothetical protein